MIESSTLAEPWENCVADLLGVCCQPGTSPAPQYELDQAVRQALAVTAQPEPMTATFRARVGLTALDLTTDQPTPYDSRLPAAIIEVASCDAYAARDVLGHDGMRSQMTRQQERDLAAVLTASGLGTRNLPRSHLDALTAAVDTAEGRLRTLLAETTPKAAFPA